VPEGSDNWIDDRMNWTLGCISLKNADITDLYESIGKDTKVLIVK
jgi:lipoprotein-anchoring transpeptidase ErfK/SrfK